MSLLHVRKIDRHPETFRLRPPRVQFGSGGATYVEPMTGRERAITRGNMTNTQIVRIVLDRYKEPKPEAESPEPVVEPGPEVVTAPTSENAPAVTRVVQPVLNPVASWPTTQASVLNMTAADHEAILAGLQTHVRDAVLAQLPGAQLGRAVVAGGPGAVPVVAAPRLPEPEWLEAERHKQPLYGLIEYMNSRAAQYGMPSVRVPQTASVAALKTIIRSYGLQYGFGVSGKAGLATQAIIELLHSIDHRYVPVIASDQVDQLALPKAGNLSFIMNLDPSVLGGSHWIAVNIDTMHGKFLEYFDPLGASPTPDFLRRIQAVVGQSASLLKLKVNTVPDQSITSSNCGWFCIKFLHERVTLGHSWLKASGYDTDGERLVENFKRRYI
jgi:hypothetical protein